jgi:radical SAM superfamily enzyme YgiQ (UPF0313 family)
MQRGVTVEQVQAAVALCKSHGIQTGMFLMWGYEGEEADDVEATIRHVKKTDPDIFFTTIAYPIKGTPYFSQVAPRVENAKPWHAGSDREARIVGRHSRRFYGFADQLLRTEVELERLRKNSDLENATVADLQRKIVGIRADLYAAAPEVEG